jgi:hypothetical protein
MVYLLEKGVGIYLYSAMPFSQGLTGIALAQARRARLSKTAMASFGT